MAIISSHQNPEALTFTIVAEFEAGVDRVWQIWEDPRQLERWWGPPTWPATFETHEFTPGGTARYYMTGPDGGRERGWWKITAVQPPHHLEFDDGFADENWNPVTDLGSTHAVVTLEDLGGRTRMTTVSTFQSAEQLEQMLSMGMEEGMNEAMGQIDALLAKPAAV